MNRSLAAIRNVLVLIAVIGAFYLSTLRPGQSWDDDFAMYVHEAKNIALGLDYSQTGYIYQREYARLGPRTYPPGFPLLLAGVYKSFGLNLTAMKVEEVVFFLASLLAIAFTFQRDLSTKQLLALVAMIGFSPYFWSFKDQIVSDIPFLLLAYLALLLIHRYEQRQFIADGSAALAGLAMWAAYSTRTVGVSLLAALWLRDAVRLRKLSRFSVIATLVFVPGAALEYLLCPRRIQLPRSTRVRAGFLFARDRLYQIFLGLVGQRLQLGRFACLRSAFFPAWR